MGGPLADAEDPRIDLSSLVRDASTVDNSEQGGTLHEQGKNPLLLTCSAAFRRVGFSGKSRLHQDGACQALKIRELLRAPDQDASTVDNNEHNGTRQKPLLLTCSAAFRRVGFSSKSRLHHDGASAVSAAGIAKIPTIPEEPMKTKKEQERLSHVAASGDAKMVDVSNKESTDRIAKARGSIRMLPETLAAIEANTLKKGDVLSVARVAGILAAKRTPELIPLCHPIPLTDIQIEVRPDRALPGIIAEATARANWKTGVEMEALTAVTVCLLTVYDMAKAVDRGMELGDISLVQKSGGKLGNWSRG